MKEESDQLKAKLIEVSDKNAQLQREQTASQQAFLIETQSLRRELDLLQNAQFELNEIKGAAILKQLS